MILVWGNDPVMRYVGIILILVQVLPMSLGYFQQGLTTLPDAATTVVLALLLVLFAIRIYNSERYAAAAAGDDDRTSSSNAHDRQAKLSKIVESIRKCPVEEFVLEKDYNRCSVSQLQSMLHVRKTTTKTNDETQFIEKSELVDAVRKARNFCDSCCICLETFQQGDVLRVLPTCRHEFHLECLDQWAYTFADSRKREKAPSCPLCNTKI